MKQTKNNCNQLITTNYNREYITYVKERYVIPDYESGGQEFESLRVHTSFLNTFGYLRQKESKVQKSCGSLMATSFNF